MRLRVQTTLTSVAMLLAAGLAPAAAPDEAPARGLVERLLPAQASQIDVALIPPAEDGGDVFEVETVGGRLVLRGNSGVSIGAALNWYLHDVAHAQLSWNGDNPPAPGPLPPVPAKVRVVSPYRYRSYLNYCTFNYTMSWWDWPRWEREIDWMALHGVTQPLATTGQEAVWQATLRRLGMSEAEIGRFLVGPAYLAWQWLGNIEHWAGPLPQSWIDAHRELGRRILDRERALGMTPVLQGFAGTVPLALIRMFPEARIRPKAIWGLVPPGTAQLDPEDPLFAKIGRIFLEEQQRLFGDSHYFAADPFHEGTPPNTDPGYLPAVGAALDRVLRDFDPQAVVVMQGWSIREGIVRGIPADHLLVFDLTGQKWRETQAFWGRPWVAGVLHNYGGNSFLGGDLSAVARNAPGLLGRPEGGRLVGVGFFPEAIEQNPIVADLAFDLGWRRPAPDLAAWVHAWVVARYGRDLPAAQSAWARLRDSVYRGGMTETQSPLCARPSLEVQTAVAWHVIARDYRPEEVWAAWSELLAAADELGPVDTYRFDLADVARQALADLSWPLQCEVERAWQAGDRARFQAACARFLDLGSDLDALAGTRREWLLGRWLDAARGWGTTPAERDLYEWNARLLLTVWGPASPDTVTFDYASRHWAGLIRGFYLKRWEQFFAFLATQPADYTEAKLRRVEGRPANDASDFYRALSRWEYAWCEGHESYPAEPAGDTVALARALLGKWSPAMRATYPSFNWLRYANSPAKN